MCLCKRPPRAEAVRLRLVDAKKTEHVCPDDGELNDVLRKRRELAIGGGDECERELCASFDEESDAISSFGWWRDNGTRCPVLC